MTKKQKVVFAVVAVVIVLGMIMSYAFLMKNQHIDSTPEEKKMPAMSDTEDYEVRESDESIQSSETEEDYYMTSMDGRRFSSALQTAGGRFPVLA